MKTGREGRVINEGVVLVPTSFRVSYGIVGWQYGWLLYGGQRTPDSPSYSVKFTRFDAIRVKFISWRGISITSRPICRVVIYLIHVSRNIVRKITVKKVTVSRETLKNYVSHEDYEERKNKRVREIWIFKEKKRKREKKVFKFDHWSLCVSVFIDRPKRTVFFWRVWSYFSFDDSRSRCLIVCTLRAGNVQHKNEGGKCVDSRGKMIQSSR